jgi:hypothetical protein
MENKLCLDISSTIDSDKSAEDLEGTELADEPASVVEAIISAKEIIAEALVSGQAVPRDAEFSVTDSEHRQLYVFPFSLAADQSTERISQAIGAAGSASVDW